MVKVFLAYILLCQPNVGQRDAHQIAKGIVDASIIYKVNPRVILAVAQVESSFRPHIVSQKGAIGVMQIRWKVHKDNISDLAYNRRDLFHPYLNVICGTRILKQYGINKHFRRALMKYFGDTGWRGRAYVRKVIKAIREFDEWFKFHKEEAKRGD